jgi:MtN3 and saliva related transmembrane protein
MDFTVIGLAAGACTTVAFLPQLLKALRTRSTRDISLKSFTLLVLGVLLWLAYGLLIGDLPIIAANVLTLVIAAGIVTLKLRYG